MVEVAPILGPFLARPPTPPRESSSKLSSNTVYFNGVPATNCLLDTPDESPASSAEYFKESSGKARKRVGFSGWTQYHKHSPAGSKSYDSDEQRRRLPPSRECNPKKSILKPHVDTSSVTSKENLPYRPTSLPDMLRSAASHLGSDSRSARIDAYTSLLGCLSAYEDFLDPQILAEKGAEITGAIRRDVDARNGDGSRDAQLAAHALKLVTVLLCTKGTTNLLPDEFCSSTFEQSLACMEDPDAPKMLVSHHMHLIEKQRFSPKVMTTERVSRLLLVLSMITTRVKGNRVVCHRLNIYQRLLTQARAIMISRVGSWVDNLVSGMLSTIKEVRARAIAFGMEAGLQLGTIASVSQECMNVFNRQSPEGTKVVSFLASRLTEMTRTKEDGLHVPQIWSVVVLFFRSRTQQIERWEHLKLWLGILQQCFNSSDAQIKFQANIAWNRFIFALDVNMSTSISMARMLKQPIVSQLERKSTERNVKLAKQIARSSYCTLLYYAFRPSATHAQLDQYWDMYVEDLLPKAFSGSPTDIDYACHILANLFFNNSQPRVWDANKANATGPMKPEDLPVIDSKWIRSKTERILEILKKMFELADWKETENCPAVFAWRSLMSALGNASSKEVKVSMGTMTAVAKIVNCLRQFLIQRNSNSDGPDEVEKFNILLKDAVAKIGHIPFNENRLLLTQSRDFEAAGETPSSRGTSRSTSLDSAAAHLVNLLLEVHDGNSLAPRKLAFMTVVQLNLQNASSRRSRLKNLRNIARQITPIHPSSQAEGSLLLWNSIAEEMIGALNLPRTTEKHNESPEYSGHEYRDVVKVLELGVYLHSEMTHVAWATLFDCLCDALEKEVGNVGIVLLVGEALTDIIGKEIARQCYETTFRFAASVLRRIQWPINSKIIDHAQMQLWGVQPIQHKSDPMESLKPCQRLMNTLLQATYASVESSSEAVICQNIAVANRFVKIVPHENGRHFLKENQQGFGFWFEDAKTAIAERSNVFGEVKRMYETVQCILESADRFDNTSMAEFEALFISCLRSRHKYIVNQCVLTWNRTLGGASTLDYPVELQEVLLKLKDRTNIQLPGFPQFADNEATPSPLRFRDSSESEEEIPRIPYATSNKRTPSEQPSAPFSTPPRRFATASPNLTSASKGPNWPQSGRRDAKTTPNAKLRHNDSQVQFAAIESSPLADDGIDSQMLTDRQKEVKERQERDAALFPDIRSSPGGAPVVPPYRLPSLAPNSTDAPSRLPVDETSSPSFPPDAMMNDFLGSSPTPSSSRKRSEGPYSDDGPPSSPPMISSQLRIRRTVLSPGHRQVDQTDEEPPEDKQNEDGTREVAFPIFPPVKIAEDQSWNGPRDSTSETSEPQARRSDVDTNFLSDMDIYVDAPTEPSRDMSLEPSVVDAVKEQSQNQESSPSAIENDPVTAQIMGEIAKAASQRSSLDALDMQQADEVTKKRKATSADVPRKRRKSAALAPSSGEVVADCVLIENSAPLGHPEQMDPDSRPEQQCSPPARGLISTSSDNIFSVGTTGGDPTRGPQETALTVETPAGVRRKVHVKAEPGTSRRSGRLTRTSSRLSDISTESPTRSKAGEASQAPADSDPLPWVSGPRGSRWAYVPAIAAHDANTLVPPRPVGETNDDDGAPAGLREEVGHAACSGRNPAQTVEEGGETPTANGILQGLRNMLDQIRNVSLRPEEERQMVSVLFESVHQVHEAGRRQGTR